VAAVEDRPTTGLDLLGDEPLTAKRHRADLDLLFGVVRSILGRAETNGSPSRRTQAAKPSGRPLVAAQLRLHPQSRSMARHPVRWSSPGLGPPCGSPAHSPAVQAPISHEIGRNKY
jgi:hypothetical protein